MLPAATARASGPGGGCSAGLARGDVVGHPRRGGASIAHRSPMPSRRGSRSSQPGGGRSHHSNHQRCAAALTGFFIVKYRPGDGAHLQCGMWEESVGSEHTCTHTRIRIPTTTVHVLVGTYVRTLGWSMECGRNVDAARSRGPARAEAGEAVPLEEYQSSGPPASCGRICTARGPSPRFLWAAY
eukprot:COSAG01_NODE_434_length_17079_cov_11.829270_12_plen_184_part_00